ASHNLAPAGKSSQRTGYGCQWISMVNQQFRVQRNYQGTDCCYGAWLNRIPQHESAGLGEATNLWAGTWSIRWQEFIAERARTQDQGKAMNGRLEHRNFIFDLDQLSS